MATTNTQQATPITWESLDEFTRGYVECALWLLDPESTSGRFDDAEDAFPALDSATLTAMVSDCRDFRDLIAQLIEENHADLDGCDENPVTLIDDNQGQAGHDFYLTRNRHGAGFWDGDWPSVEGKLLTKWSHTFGTFALYVGDDGRIYHHN